jgi:hypothetical protein
MRSSQSLGIRSGTNKHSCSTRRSGLRDDPSGRRSVKLPTGFFERPSFDFSSNNAIESTTPSSAPSFVVQLSMPANVEVPSTSGALRPAGRAATTGRKRAALRPKPARRRSGRQRGQLHAPASRAPRLPVPSPVILHQAWTLRLRSSRASADDALWLLRSRARTAQHQLALRVWHQTWPARGRSPANMGWQNSLISTQRVRPPRRPPVIAECS